MRSIKLKQYFSCTSSANWMVQVSYAHTITGTPTYSTGSQLNTYKQRAYAPSLRAV